MMHPPSAAQLIGAWEAGVSRHSVDRALTLLAAACPEMTFAELAALPVGRRDACLLELRESLFGPSLDCYAECPRCQARLEFRADVRELLTRTHVNQDPLRRELVCGDVQLRYRAPDSADLAAISCCADAVAARSLLLERCVLKATRGGTPLALGEISAQALDELSSELGASEKCADISFGLQCTACAHSWDLAFDIASFLWTEVSLLAKRYLHEVHTLAWAYGWREADILGMSPARRRFYLDRVEG
jgi:hypothetical protein